MSHLAQTLSCQVLSWIQKFDWHQVGCLGGLVPLACKSADVLHASLRHSSPPLHPDDCYLNCHSTSRHSYLRRPGSTGVVLFV